MMWRDGRGAAPLRTQVAVALVAVAGGLVAAAGLGAVAAWRLLALVLGAG